MERGRQRGLIDTYRDTNIDGQRQVHTEDSKRQTDKKTEAHTERRGHRTVKDRQTYIVTH